MVHKILRIYRPNSQDSIQGAQCFVYFAGLDLQKMTYYTNFTSINRITLPFFLRFL